MRCAAHPARPARDRCPTCDRPRCAADVARGDRCAVCADRDARGVREPLAVLVGAAVIGTVGGAAGAALGQEYVGARVFSVAFPALVGLVLAALAAAWAGPLRPALRHAAAVAVAAYAGISALLDFRFTDEPFGPAGRWLPPLVAAVAAAFMGAEVLAHRPVSARDGVGRAPASTSGR